jgi:hypothetical protein
MEAETAISLLQPPEQNPVRYLIVKNLEWLGQNHKPKAPLNKNTAQKKVN